MVAECIGADGIAECSDCAACGQCHPKPPRSSGKMAGLASRAAHANARAIFLSRGWTIGA